MSGNARSVGANQAVVVTADRRLECLGGSDHGSAAAVREGMMSQGMRAVDGGANRSTRTLARVVWRPGFSRWLLLAGLLLASVSRVEAISILKAFQGDPTAGYNPQSALVRDGAGNLYGTTYYGGGSDQGTIFRVKSDGTGFAVLHSFSGSATDGAYPYASLILDGAGNLFGTTELGGALAGGTVFTIKSDGTGFAVLHSFSGSATDGASPWASLILDGSGNLYGTTYGGGASGDGTVFTIKSDGTGFAVLHSFSGSAADGASPWASLALDGAGHLYGTTYGGGASGDGTVFTIKSDGTGFAVLHSFTGGTTDGAYPVASLILDGSGNLYGTSVNGGASGQGTVFTIKSDGTGFVVLHSFSWSATDGATPYASLILDGSSNLYGTTEYGGASGDGTVFTLKTNGTGFAVLHSFSGSATDGWYPQASLILDASGNLYGTSKYGGASGNGTVFTMTTGGAGFSVLHSFAGWASDGANPYASLVLDSGGTLYGTTSQGGAWNLGTVFALPTTGDLPPQQLTVAKAGAGSGVVASAPGGINCGLTCSAWFVDSTPVTLTATPSTGSTFAGWSGEGCSGTGTCQVTMDQARNVTATFDLGTPGALFHPVTPCRILDTRVSTGPTGGLPLAAGQRYLFTAVDGVCGVPTWAAAIVSNLTVVGSTAVGELKVMGGHLLSTNTSALSFGVSRARANNAIVQLATDGSGTISVINNSAGTVHFILDVNGYFQ